MSLKSYSCTLHNRKVISYGHIFDRHSHLVEIDFVTYRFRYSVARDLHCCLVIQSEHDVLIESRHNFS